MEKPIDDLVRARKWPFIRQAWNSYLQYRQPPPAGLLPPLTFNTLLNDGSIFIDPVTAKQLTDTQQPRAEIGEVILNEGIYWLHKALHVLAASEKHIDHGMPTWSISSAYQSAYFAGRAILGFLGIGVGEIGTISVIADLCRDVQGIPESKLSKTGAFSDDVRIRSFGVLLDHRQIWYLFQRALRVTNCDVWNADCAYFLENLKSVQITRQRHGLHYDLDYWIIRQDLDAPFCPEDFLNFGVRGQGKELYDVNQDNFSVALAKEIVVMALALFRDLPSPFLTAEKTLIESLITDDRYPNLEPSLSLAEAGVA